MARYKEMAALTCSHSFLFHLVFATLFAYVAAQGDKYLLETNGAIQTWGHPVIKRNQTGLATTATHPRSWVDYDVALPVGRLVRFLAYINRIDESTTASPQVSPTTNLSLQIWYALSRTTYRLLYEKWVEANNTEGIIRVDVDEDVYLPSYCRMGWTSEAAIVPISFDFVDGYHLYDRAINNPATDFPETSQVYSDFFYSPYPAVFSVAVEIDPRLIGATGATGPSGGFGGNGSYGGNASNGLMGATGASGLPGPPGPPGAPGYGSGGQIGSDIDYTRCSNVTSLPPGSSNCSQVTCNNLDGSKSCMCVSGYALASDLKTCNDMNECLVNNGGCTYICTNTIGSFFCSCPVGLVLSNNSKDCVDVNECSYLKNDCYQYCLNTFGSYYCIGLQAAKQPLQGQDNQNLQDSSITLNSSATTTGVLIWIAILTLAILLLAIVSVIRWRKSSRKDDRHSSAPPSAGTFDGQSVDADDVSHASLAGFSNWKLSVSDRKTSLGTNKRPSSRLGIPSIFSLHPDGEVIVDAEQNSKL